MICPYCKTEIKTNSGFCPECGQDISGAKHQNQSDAYWKNVNQEDSKRSKEYKDLVDKSKREANSRRSKKLVTTIVVLVVVALSALGIFKFQQH